MATTVKNCRECGRLFNYITGIQLCPACKDLLEQKFQKAKQFINENKSASVAEVAEFAEVTEQQIRQWVREERLIFTNASLSGVCCESCGEPILTGRFCDKCKNQTMLDLASVGRRPEPQQIIKKPEKESPRMRFLDRK